MIAPVATRPLPLRQVPEVDYTDGVQNPVEMALLLGTDQVLQTFGAPYAKPGAEFRFEGRITRTDQPEFKQHFHGDIKISPDGFSGSSQSYYGPCPPDQDNTGQPGTRVFENSLTEFMKGTRTQGQITPGRTDGFNEEFWTTAGWNGATVIRGHVDGLPVAESSWMVFDGTWTPTWVHQGTLAGENFERTMREAPDGSTRIQGTLAGLPETGRAELGVDGKLHIIRDIGP
ncbi:MAG: hypothetical protein AB1758_14560, partial [Candidatus Eremiobacterota bacterium]